MKKIITINILIFLFIHVSNAQQKEIADFSKSWPGYIEIENSQLSRHILNDIPGSIIVFVPSGDGTYTTRILGEKILKSTTKLPEINVKPQVLVHGFSKKETVIGVSYLSFISASMTEKDEVNLTVTESSSSSILDGDIDWPAANKRIEDFKTKNNGKIEGVLFAVIKVASVITLEHQIFSSVNRAAKISGYGFAGNGSFLTEKGKENNTFKVGVDVVYTDDSVVQLAMATRQTNKTPDMKSILKANGIELGTVQDPGQAAEPDRNVKVDPKIIFPFLIQPKEYKGDILE